MAKQVPVPIIKMNEPSFEIHLANGAVLCVRTLIMAAYQNMTDSGEPIIGNDGKPLFGLNIQNLVAVLQEPVERKEMN